MLGARRGMGGGWADALPRARDGRVKSQVLAITHFDTSTILQLVLSESHK